MYTLESFQKKIDELYPNEKVKILEFNGVKQPCSFKCLKCGGTTAVAKGEVLNKKGKQFLCLKCNPGYSTSKITKDCGEKIEFVLKKNKNLKVIQGFHKITEDMEFQCKLCGNIFKRKPQVFLKSQKCPYCESRSKTKPENLFQREIRDLYNDDYVFLEPYINAHTKIKVRHKCGFIYSVRPTSLLRGQQCPKCSKKCSKGEKEIIKYLAERNIKYTFQHKAEIKKHHLFFDFYVPDYNLLIEFQGAQHFQPIDFFGGEENFKRQAANDDLKRNYCRENNINLLEIPYTDLQNVSDVLNKWFNDYPEREQIQANRKNSSLIIENDIV